MITPVDRRENAASPYLVERMREANVAFANVPTRAKRGGGAFREGFAGDTASPITFRRYFSRLLLLRVLRVSACQ